MGPLTKFYIKVRELPMRFERAQTMTEYALILAAVAIVVFVTYQVMGQDLTHLITWQVDNDLSAS